MDNKVIGAYFRCLHRQSKNMACSQYALIVLEWRTRNSVVQQNPTATGTRHGERHLLIPKGYIQTSRTETERKGPLPRQK